MIKTNNIEIYLIRCFKNRFITGYIRFMSIK